MLQGLPEPGVLTIKIGRNAPCPCSSGKKYKHCCLADEPELMDSEMAFEMLNQIYGGSIEHGEHERFLGLLSALQERQPDIYEHESHRTNQSAGREHSLSSFGSMNASGLKF